MVLARRTIASLALFAGVAAGCSAPTEGVARGEFLYQNCAQCHGVDGRGDTLVDAPQIAGLPAWYVTEQVQRFRGGLRGAHHYDVEGLKMRPMARTIKSAADVAFVAEYVATLPPADPATTVKGDSAKGQTAYATCAACHGADGGGNEVMKAPPLRQLEDWYIVSQLNKFKTGVRGYSPDDALGAQMRGIAGGLADEVVLNDLAAYIQTLPSP